MTGHPEQFYGGVTFSQHGEDLLIVDILTRMGFDKPSFLDLGAHKPSVISNTKLLYDRGSRGINVEAKPHLIGAFLEERPEDITINKAVNVVEGEIDFYMFHEDHGMNTCLKEEADRVSEQFHTAPKDVFKVEAWTVNKIVDGCWDGVFPDFLNLDLEGLDYAVLEATDFSKSAPKLICVETRESQEREMIDMLAGKGFRFYCRMGANLFFVR
jgi:FkbM family methyltransferase